jgi:hypothetical protein
MGILLAVSASSLACPHGRWKTLTLVAALRIDGLTARYVIDGAMQAFSRLKAALRKGATLHGPRRAQTHRQARQVVCAADVCQLL